jgi:hypothetical protein
VPPALLLLQIQAQGHAVGKLPDQFLQLRAGVVLVGQLDGRALQAAALELVA